VNEEDPERDCATQEEEEEEEEKRRRSTGFIDCPEQMTEGR